jgi:hypothetical protein
MQRKIILLILLFSMVLLSCMREKKDGGRMCTTEYRMLTVTVKDFQSDPVVLSKYYVKKTATGEIIDFSKEDPYMDSINRAQGIYFLCTDGMMNMTSESGTEFEFHGILDSTELVNEKYLIANDECHVYILAGKTNIVIDPF